MKLEVSAKLKVEDGEQANCSDSVSQKLLFRDPETFHIHSAVIAPDTMTAELTVCASTFAIVVVVRPSYVSAARC